MRAHAKQLLTWDGMVGEFPPLPNPNVSRPSADHFTFFWDGDMKHRWNKELPSVFETDFLANHPKWTKLANTEKGDIIKWFTGWGKDKLKKYRTSRTARDPRAASVKRAKRARRGRQDQVRWPR